MELKARGLAFSYGAKEILHGLDLDFRPGKITGIIGPNGSGKTTLLHCLNGLLRARGEIILNGEPLRSMTRRQIASAMGLVSQKEEIHFPFSVLEVLLMGRYPRLAFLQSPGRDDYSRVHEVASMMGINHLLERRVDELSGGEFQKVMISRALAQEPSIILLDEPTLHLDLKHQLEILGRIRSITDGTGLTVIMVSHDLVLAERYCDDVIVLKSGCVHAMGPADDVLSPSMIRDVYGIDARVSHHSRSGTSTLILGRSDPEKTTNSK